MWDSIDKTAAHPAALKIVIGLAGLFVLILIGVRLAGFLQFVLTVLDRAPLVLAEPDTPGNFWLALALVAALLVFALPRGWRKIPWAVLFFGALFVVGVSGSRGVRGGPGLAHTPVAHWLQSRGYARCPAGDQIRLNWSGGTSGQYAAEAWAQPGVCPTPDGTRHAPTSD